MPETQTAIALRSHVAGPQEKERRDNRAGWEWVQRCLRCDRRIDTGEALGWRVGATVHELADGRMTAEPPPDARADSAPPCTPES